MKTNFCNEKGLTLIELLASIALLSIIIITFVGFFTNAFQYNQLNGNKLQAMNTARERQAIFKEDPDTRAALTHFLSNVKDGTVSQDDLSASNPDYQTLNLIENISETTRPGEQPNEYDPYYLLKAKQEPFQILIYLKADPDVEDRTSSTTYGAGLYRLYIQVIEDSKILSDTYTYFTYE